ncbi:hypothetical protein BDBG_08133 [Blastomyces gilchristii SLH14081]|uniref:Uncharacterized protein n=1 Tax=Blastomyces gilchristii (strain SLH14081) TaxID=559298 RepID=A0A179V0B5_BLAGS|nr:uncharacterized protein BDBG_08133 [Blastomyces gilchristii SLH14081]OAT12837.1 hypothetical protein BDBG_08133 [Blastomyces gilchristii SLH14081]
MILEESECSAIFTLLSLSMPLIIPDARDSLNCPHHHHLDCLALGILYDMHHLSINDVKLQNIPPSHLHSIREGISIHEDLEAKLFPNDGLLLQGIFLKIPFNQASWRPLAVWLPVSTQDWRLYHGLMKLRTSRHLRALSVLIFELKAQTTALLGHSIRSVAISWPDYVQLSANQKITKLIKTGGAAAPSNSRFVRDDRNALRMYLELAALRVLEDNLDPVFFMAAKGAADFAKRTQENPRGCVESERCRSLRGKKR